VSCGQHDRSLWPYSQFSRLEPLLLLPNGSSICTHEAEWTPFQTHYFSENLVAPGIEPGTSGSVARNSGHYTTALWLVCHTFFQSTRAVQNQSKCNPQIPEICVIRAGRLCPFVFGDPFIYFFGSAALHSKTLAPIWMQHPSAGGV
jgi:hypothetical protein